MRSLPGPPTPSCLATVQSILAWVSFALGLVVGGPVAMAAAEPGATTPGSLPMVPMVPVAGTAEAKRYGPGGSALDGLRGDNPHLRVGFEAKRQLQAGDTPDLIVSFELPDLASAHEMEWEDRGRYVHALLERARASAQRPLMDHFDQAGIAYQSYLVGNLMVIRQADLSVLQELTAYRATRDIAIKPDWVLIEPEKTSEFVPAGSATAEPNLVQIQANEVWSRLGITGAGITVGLNDSPPRHTHAALVNAYRGFDVESGAFDHDYNWFDPIGHQRVPAGEFHGTHVLGTLVGNEAGSPVTGVAFGAQWMACGGCSGTSCPGVLACLDFFLAPTDLNGENPDPDRRPQVVNNSWGDCGRTYSTMYESIWDSMYAAGVIPMISNGNAGTCGYASPPGPNTVGNPARAGRVMGIGSSSRTGGTYANHSNWGPTDRPNPGLDGGSFDHFGFPDIKPNVAAPGQGIRSSTADHDTAYGSATGTSMASPHASGVAALMMSAAPCLIGDHVRINSILMETANPIVYDGGPFGDAVNPEPGVNHPNYATGWGEIDALAAVEMAIAQCGPSGSLAATVIDAETGQTLSQVQVRIPNPSPDGPANFNTRTNAQGRFALVLPEGTYEISFHRFGYQVLVETVVVAEDDEFDLTFELDPAAVVNLTGSVTDGETGWGLHAQINVAGAPDSPYFTDPVTGRFSINLPESFTTEMTVVSAVPGYLSSALPVTIEEGLDVDVPLSADAALCTAPGYELAGIHFHEDFKTNGGFTSEGTNDDWEWGTPSAWPYGCTRGDTCWGTRLSGNYSDDANMSLTSPFIDLSDASGELILTWDQASHIESSAWDRAIAEISIDGGAWQSIWEHSGATSQSGWRRLRADISNAAGGSIQLRWRLITDGSVNYPGLFVDDIRIVFDESCQAPMDGSLLFGHVTDSNTGQGVGQAVASVGGLGTYSMVPTPDPSFDHGVFHAHVPGAFEVIDPVFGDRFTVSAGGQRARLLDLTVRADGDFYTGDEIDIGPLAGQTVSAFLALSAGRLDIAPPSVTQPVVLNQSVSSMVSLLNTGTWPLSFDASKLVIDTASSVYEEDFESDFPPLSGWAVENLGGDCVWARNDQLLNAAGELVAERPNYAGGQGFAAAADSDRCGVGTTMDTALVSPPLELSAVERPGYSFMLSFRPLGESRLDFDISTNGGRSWDTLQTWIGTEQSSEGPGTLISSDLTGYADESDVRLRFRFTTPGWHWYAQIDQFRLTSARQFVTARPSTGTIPPGGTSVLTLDFDASRIDLQGDYRARFMIGHDTPYDDQVTVLALSNMK